MADAVSSPFFELASDLLAVLREDGSIERANAAWRRTLGYEPSAVEGRGLAEFLTPEDAAAVPHMLEQARTSGAEGVLRAQSADGTVLSLIWRISFDSDAGRYGAAGHLPTPALDPRDELRLSEQRYRELFESHPAPMAVWDPGTGEILAANDAALVQYGYERDELNGLSVAQLVHPDDLQQLVDAVPNFGTGLAGGAIFRHRRRDGSELEVEVTGHQLQWDGRAARLVMAIDVTERRRLEEQLRQAQKMEAVGRLAGGIAHDFNNLLTAISGFSRLLLDSLPEGSPEHEDAGQIRTAAEQAASLTGQLLSFSRVGATAATTVELNESVREAHRLLVRVLGGGIEVRLMLTPREAWVTVDPAELQQVVLNLALNARDAMPKGGVLAIQTRVGSAPRWATGVRGQAVVLSVADTGSGMSTDSRERAFEPFFTTKAAGEGTGLGLASVYATVSRAGGQIRLESEMERGTTVRICLPVLRDEPPPDAAAQTGDGAGAKPKVVRILLVDDDPLVRSWAERVLRVAGFDVLAAGDAQAALARAAEAEPVDLLLSDVVLPRMSGVVLARQLQARWPELRVLLMSGHSQPLAGVGSAPYELLAKPFDDDQLVERVRAVLES